VSASTYYAQVQKLYIAYYQRPADPLGLQYWATVIDQAGGQFGGVVNAFANSTEALSLYGNISLANIGSVIDAIYLALFNRLPDPAGRAFYIAGYNAGNYTPASIALNVLSGAQGTDSATLQNKLLAANNFTAAVDGHALNSPGFASTSAASTYAGNAQAVSARSILGTVTSDSSTLLNPAQVTYLLQQQFASPNDAILKNGASNIFTLNAANINATGTVGNDIFIADNTGQIKNTSIQGTIIGGGGSDTLKIFSANTTTPALDPLPNLVGIQTLYIVGANYRGLNLDVSGISGLGTIILENSPQTWTPAPTQFFSPTSTTIVTLANGQSLTLSSLVPTVPSAGGSAANNFAVNFVTVLSSAVSVQSQSLVLNNVVSGSHLGSDGNSYTDTNSINIAGAGVGVLNLSSIGASNSVNLYNAGNGLGAINVSGNKALNITYFAGTAALVAINDSACSASVNFVLSSANLFGSCSLTSNFVFNGGSADNSLDISSANVAGKVINAAAINQMTFNSGIGANTLVLNSATIEGSSAVTSLTNIQTVGDAFAGGAGGIIDMTNFASATGLKLVYSDQGVITVNNLPSNAKFDEGTSIQGNNSITVNAVGSGTNDVLTWVLGTSMGPFGGAGGTAKTSINGYETINLVVQGGPATVAGGLGSVVLTPSSGGVQTLNISLGSDLIFSGAGSLSLQSAVSNTININGPGNLNVAGGIVSGTLTGSGSGNVTVNGASAVGSVDFGAATGLIQFNDGNATSGARIKVGNGGCVITAGAFNDQITVGSGVNSITGGAGGDAINIFHGGANNVTTLNYSPLAQADTAPAISANGVLVGADVITGAQRGDIVNTQLTGIVGVQTALNGSFAGVSSAANGAYIVRGSFNPSTSIFVASATGSDSLLEWTDATGGSGHTNAIVLVGYAGNANSTAAAGLIALG
jgi:hypothetical protein